MSWKEIAAKTGIPLTAIAHRWDRVLKKRLPTREEPEKEGADMKLTDIEIDGEKGIIRAPEDTTVLLEDLSQTTESAAAEAPVTAQPENETAIEPMIASAAGHELCDELRAVLTAVDWTSICVLIETGNSTDITIRKKRSTK